MSRHRLLLCATVLALAPACGDGVVPLASPTTTTPTTEAAPSTQTTQGGEARAFVAEPIALEDCGGGVECGTMEVPLDYDDPDGPTIELAVVRIPARDEAARIGVLLTNPGGPGASGIEFALAQPFTDEVLDRFDIIGWDPRGVGESEAIGCGDEVAGFLDQDPGPDDAQERQALDDAARAVAEECEDEDGELLPHVGTADVVQDMDAIRQALSEDQISYAGFSYGTSLGLHYLDRFADRARAVVLDGVVDPSQGLPEFLADQAVAIEGVLNELLTSCEGDPDCPLEDAAASFGRVAAAVEEQPLPAGDDDVGPAEFQTGAVYATYQFSPDDRIALFEALADGEAGDGEGFAALAAAYEDLGGFTAYAAVNCVDSDVPDGAADYREFANGLIEAAPRIGATVANELLPCAFWSAEPSLEPHQIVAEGSPPVLVVGTTGDAATPYEQAVDVAATLSDGHLLTFEGDGHVASGRSDCIDDVESRYLITLDVPADGTVC